MLLFMKITISMVLGVAGLTTLIISLRWLRYDSIFKRLVQYVGLPSENNVNRVNFGQIQPRIITGSLASRVFTPAILGIGRFFGRLTPGGANEGLAKKLLIAGNPLGLGAREFYGVNLATTLLGVYLAFMIIRRGTTLLNIVLSILFMVILYILPKVWLQSRGAQRQNSVRKGLADALDMLSVCATAGLGFDQSLQRVSEYWDTPIGHEFGRVISEMDMGLTRREALRNLSDRLDIREISSFVALILQTEQIGMSVSDTLHGQAEQMRIERRFRAQEQAQRAPIKMLIPMALLIFPALLAVILGPSIPTLMEVFKTL
jgi:tight adherence protein C